MSPNERALLIEIARRSDRHLRPIGEIRVANGLQASGMATVNHVDAKTIRVTPTENGRRWVALIANRNPALNGRQTKRSANV